MTPVGAAPRGRVIVGLHGSPSSRAALVYGAHVARRTRRPVIAVLVTSEASEAVEYHLQQVVLDVLAPVTHCLDVRLRVESGPSVGHTLASIAHHPLDTLVVGTASSGRGHLGVADQLAHVTPCPLIAVPANTLGAAAGPKEAVGPGPARPDLARMNSRAVAFGDADALVQSWPAAGHLPAGRLVVPFTGSMASHTALRYAGAYAASTEGACICAVTARRRLSLRTARRQMSQFVTATIRATADQQIGCQAVARSLRRALVALACHPADLLVLGTPGADGDRDGAVRRYCLERARCPVLLTPSWLAGAAVLGPEQLAVQRAV